MSKLLIKNSMLRNREGLWNILIENDKISKILNSNEWEKNVNSSQEVAGENETIDADGKLVLPPYVDPHVHLDAVLVAGKLKRSNKSGTLLEAIDIWGEWKATLTKEIIKNNAKEVIKWYIANGVLKVRTHADCTEPTLITVESLLELRDEMKEFVDIQVVAFPQNGIYTDKINEGLMIKAIEMGVDVIGGAPHIEYTREDGVKTVEFVYSLAEKYDKLIDIHIDETGDPHSRFVEVMAKENINREMFGLATASHTTAMHNYNNDYAFKLIGNLKKAEMNMVTNPFDNSVLQNRTDGYPRKRGHTRVDELLEKGVNVAIGHDSIMDPWYSMGKGNMVEAANLLMHMAHMNGSDQILQLMDMITLNSAKMMKLEGYGLEEGNQADIVVTNAKSEAEIVRLASDNLYVIRKGKVICNTKPTLREINFTAGKELVDFKVK